jgi:hypothetical protein
MGECKACKSPDREAIEADMQTGVALLRIAHAYGVSEYSLRQHRQHMPAAVKHKRGRKRGLTKQPGAGSTAAVVALRPPPAPPRAPSAAPKRESTTASKAPANRGGVDAEIEYVVALARRLLRDIEERVVADTFEAARVAAALRRELTIGLARLRELRTVVSPTIGDVRVDPRDVYKLSRLTPSELCVVIEEVLEDARRMAAEEIR